jgi:hypothetical protein
MEDIKKKIAIQDISNHIRLRQGVYMKDSLFKKKREQMAEAMFNVFGLEMIKEINLIRGFTPYWQLEYYKK